MATQQKNDTKIVAPTAAQIAQVNSNEYMPEGYDEKEFREVGSFMPMYKPKNAFDKKYPVLYGWLSHVEALPVIKDAKNNEPDRTPLMAHVIVAKPTRGVNGPRGEEVEVERVPGDAILVPIGGNLLFNKPFMTAVFDPKYVWFVRLEVTGTRPSDYPSDTWVWKTEIYSKNPKLRMGTQFGMVETALMPEIIAQLPKKTISQLPASAYMRGGTQLAQTSSGAMYDADGVVHEGKLVGQGAGANASA